MLGAFAAELRSWVDWACAHSPGRVGGALRRVAARSALKSCGRGVEVGFGTWFNGGANIELASDIGIGRYCSFEACGGKISIGAGTRLNSNVILGADFGEIRIGRDVLIGMNTVIRAANHRFDRSPAVPIRLQGHEGGVVKIGDDVWIGANVVITAGAEIGAHSVIGAGSVVTGVIPPGSVAAGIPARVIKQIAGS